MCTQVCEMVVVSGWPWKVTPVIPQVPSNQNVCLRGRAHDCVSVGVSGVMLFWSTSICPR